MFNASESRNWITGSNNWWVCFGSICDCFDENLRFQNTQPTINNIEEEPDKLFAFPDILIDNLELDAARLEESVHNRQLFEQIEIKSEDFLIDQSDTFNHENEFGGIEEDPVDVATLTNAPKKLFPCSNCNKSFTTESYLQRHYALSHGSSKKINCKLCNKPYKTTAMKKHLAQHAETSVKLFTCNICDKDFKTEGFWKLHMRSEELKMNAPAEKRVKKTVKNILCDKCDSKFFNKGQVGWNLF